MIIAFTGHRDIVLKYETDLDIISKIILINGEPFSHTWIHGGAEGFDTQVQKYASANNVAYGIYKPDYKKYADRPKFAPIARNMTMVDECDFLVALWDHRVTGGTASTIQYAIQLNKPWINLFNPQRVRKTNE